MKAIDTHAHLDHFDNPALVLQEAAAAGVQAIVAVSVDLTSMRKILVLRRECFCPEILAGLGVHPGSIRSEETAEALKFIREHAGEIQAIGEIGLDFGYKGVRNDTFKKQEQREVFRRQLEIARETGLPAIIHARGTWRECFETAGNTGISRAVFHWYSGPRDVLRDILDAGYYVSAAPSLAYSAPSREAITLAPPEQTLIETDCPVLYRDPRGEFTAAPKDVFRTLEAYAALKGMAPAEALEILNANARRLFGMPPAAE